MNIDRGTFLLLVSTLAIGASGGYVAAERHVFPELDRWRGRGPEPTPEPPHAASVADAAPPANSAPAPVAAPAPAPAAPSCDDSVATVGECPAPGYPTVEGGCGGFASVRCGELKQAMKPKVAAAAVACVNKLTPQERCDAARVYLCGHLALVNACPERDDASASADASTAGTKSVGSICQAIVDVCGSSPVAPSTTECRQLLSGMTETGRDRTRACMKTHCFDRGLVGCEGVTK